MFDYLNIYLGKINTVIKSKLNSLFSFLENNLSSMEVKYDY